MLSVQDIETYIEEEDVESKTIELKSMVASTSEEKKNLAKVVVAFTNTEGGHIIIGIADAKPPGQPRPVSNVCPPEQRDEIVRRLRQILHDRIQPSVFSRTQIHPVELRKYVASVVVIEVKPPKEGKELVYLKDGETYIPYRRAEKQCLPMRPEEIADFYEEYTYEKAEKKARREIREREAKVQEILESVLSDLAYGQLSKDDLIPLAQVDDLLQAAGEGEIEETLGEVKRRLEVTSLLRWWDKGVDFLDEAMRRYYAAKYLATLDAEEITSLLGEPRWDRVWPHLFSIVEEKEKAERLLKKMIEEEQLTLALYCYSQRRDQTVGVISEHLKERLLRQARRKLNDDDEIQRLFIEHLSCKDPSSDVRQTVLRSLGPEYLQQISLSVIQALLRALDDPVRNCRREAIKSLDEIAQRGQFPSESLYLVERKIRECLERQKDALQEEEDIWPEFIALLGRIGNSLETLELLEEIQRKMEFESQLEPLKELVQDALQSVKGRIG